jgi:hypothetical protein
MYCQGVFIIKKGNYLGEIYEFTNLTNLRISISVLVFVNSSNP